eukprot:Clim_evm31s148 gene=Clim_evmTU31s148
MSKFLGNLQQRYLEKTGKTAFEKTEELDQDTEELFNLVQSTAKYYKAIASKTGDVLAPVRIKDEENGLARAVKKLPAHKMLGPLDDAVSGLGGERALLGNTVKSVRTMESGLAEEQAHLSDDIHSGFIDPMHHIIDDQLKHIISLRKKLGNQRLTADAAKQRWATQTDNVKQDQALAVFEDEKYKFEAIKDDLQTKLFEFLTNQDEHVAKFYHLLEAQLDYHRKCSQLLEVNINSLKQANKDLSRARVFGQPLKQHLAASGRRYPVIVEHCTGAIEANALQEEGIFRLSGSATAIKKIKALFDREGATPPNLQSEEFSGDIHAIAGALKLYFRELPDPCVPFSSYEQFIQAGKVEDHDQQLVALSQCVDGMPLEHRDTLAVMCTFLQRVVAHSEQNKMQASNMGIVFGPTLLRSPDDQRALRDSGTCNKIMTTLVTYADWFFPENVMTDIYSHEGAVAHRVPSPDLKTSIVPKQNDQQLPDPNAGMLPRVGSGHSRADSHASTHSFPPTQSQARQMRSTSESDTYVGQMSTTSCSRGHSRQASAEPGGSRPGSVKKVKAPPPPAPKAPGHRRTDSRAGPPVPPKVPTTVPAPMDPTQPIDAYSPRSSLDSPSAVQQPYAVPKRTKAAAPPPVAPRPLARSPQRTTPTEYYQQDQYSQQPQQQGNDQGYQQQSYDQGYYQQQQQPGYEQSYDNGGVPLSQSYDGNSTLNRMGSNKIGVQVMPGITPNDVAPRPHRNTHSRPPRHHAEDHTQHQQPATPPCRDCGCEDYNKDPFKNRCANCFHPH